MNGEHIGELKGSQLKARGLSDGQARGGWQVGMAGAWRVAGSGKKRQKMPKKSLEAK